MICLNLNNVLWAGTDAALDAALKLESRLAGLDVQQAMKAGMFDDDASAKPFTQVGNTAIVPIRGSLVNVDSPILKFFGVSSYPDIKRSLIAAATDASVEQILLDVDSGGGTVSGVADTGDLIARIHAQVKPVTTFADGNMMSAAYWLGASAGQVFASRTSMLGSIGVIMTHLDMTGKLAQEGVKPTILRAGKYKALMNPMETLSPEAREQAETMMAAAYDVFVSHVAASRDVSVEVAHKKMADGREFFGQAAVTAGLADGIGSFDAVLSALQSAKKVDRTPARR